MKAFSTTMWTIKPVVEWVFKDVKAFLQSGVRLETLGPTRRINLWGIAPSVLLELGENANTKDDVGLKHEIMVDLISCINETF